MGCNLYVCMPNRNDVEFKVRKMKNAFPIITLCLSILFPTVALASSDIPECLPSWSDWQPYFDTYGMKHAISARDQTDYLGAPKGSHSREDGHRVRFYTTSANAEGERNWFQLDKNEKTGQVCLWFIGRNWKALPGFDVMDIPSSQPDLNWIGNSYCVSDSYRTLVSSFAYAHAFPAYTMSADGNKYVILVNRRGGWTMFQLGATKQCIVIVGTLLVEH